MNEKYVEYFKEYKMDLLLQTFEEANSDINDKLTTKKTYLPELKDLYTLHNIIIKTKRTTVLEFGVGWSSYVLASALGTCKEEMKSDVSEYRRNNPFELHSVDNYEEYIDIAKERIPDHLKENTFFYHSHVEMVNWNGRYSTQYKNLPLISPDFIYLDAPHQFGVENKICGWSTAHKDLMPMSCDILKIEHFLTPGTIIVVDGRAANARFLKSNFQRKWDYKYCEDRDQHFFLMSEKPLGKINAKIIKDIYHCDGVIKIDDF